MNKSLGALVGGLGVFLLIVAGSNLLSYVGTTVQIMREEKREGKEVAHKLAEYFRDTFSGKDPILSVSGYGCRKAANSYLRNK